MTEESLVELAASIRVSGVLQPIVVRPISDGSYELIAGERRWRAARRAGLTAIPAVVRAADDEETGTLALVENVQREDLNPIDRAHAMRTLAERFSLTHAELASRLGIARTSVTNFIRLTELEEAVQTLVQRRALSMGHAKVLLGMPEGALRIQLAASAAEQRWSVRELERQVKDAEVDSGASAQMSERSGEESGVYQPSRGDVRRLTAITDLERRIEEALGTRVRIKTAAGGTRGSIELKFMSLEHFDDLLARLNVKPD